MARITYPTPAVYLNDHNAHLARHTMPGTITTNGCVAAAMPHCHGQYVGLTRNGWIALGQQVLRILTRPGQAAAKQLRTDGHTTTVLEGCSADGSESIQVVATSRKKAESVTGGRGSWIRTAFGLWTTYVRRRRLRSRDTARRGGVWTPRRNDRAPWLPTGVVASIRKSPQMSIRRVRRRSCTSNRETGYDLDLGPSEADVSAGRRR